MGTNYAPRLSPGPARNRQLIVPSGRTFGPPSRGDQLLNSRDEEILKTIHFYRYITGIDVAHRLFSPGSRKHVIEVLSGLAGGVDHARNQYLYRFGLPKAQKGNVERIFTLGVRGKELLESLGMPVEWVLPPQPGAVADVLAVSGRPQTHCNP